MPRWGSNTTSSASATNVISPRHLAHVPVMVRGRIEADTHSSAQIDAQVQDAAVSFGTGLYEVGRSTPPGHAKLQSAHYPGPLRCLRHHTTGFARRVLRALRRMVTLNPHRLNDVLRDIETLGAAMDREGPANNSPPAVAGSMRCEARFRHHHHAWVACLEWLSPLYCAAIGFPTVETAAGIDTSGCGELLLKIDWDTRRE